MECRGVSNESFEAICGEPVRDLVDGSRQDLGGSVKQEMFKERVELLAIGEAIGYPRLGIGHNTDGKKLAIRAGQPEWEKFCGHAHTTRIPAALRIGRILRDNHVTPYNPRTEARVVTPQVMEEDVEEPQPEMTVGLDLVEAFFDPKPPQTDPMVKPKRSSAAIRQQRWRDKQKERR
jgi:hypothetical protein